MTPPVKTFRIAVIPGDGIGIEVTAGAVRVLEQLEKVDGSFKLDFTELDYGSARYKATGHYTPADWLTTLSTYDAILFGAVGDPDVPDHISLWELILPMRQHFQQFVNLRPSRVLPGVDAASRAAFEGKKLDWLIVRENCEGEYAGQGGRTHQGTPLEVSTEVAIFTRAGVERFMRFAFEKASARPAKKLTVVGKANAMRYGLLMWDEIATEVASDFPDVKWDKMLVDAMTVRMVLKPETLDTIACTNLHGDILSDLAAALSGSIGIAASSSLDPTRKNPSLFEPVHGAAFDIMGKNLANPLAAIWSAAEMLNWLGVNAAAERLMGAMEKALAAKETTADLGGKLGTKEAADAVIKHL